MAEFSDYAWLVGEDAALYLTALAEDERPPLNQLKFLRRELSAERARLVVEQVELRRRAASKFCEPASQMFFTPVHLEQATDICLAGYKATRLLRSGEEL